MRPGQLAITATLYPLLAAILWGGAPLFTKRLTRDESQTAITLWPRLLLTPINGLFSLQAGSELPTGTILWLLIPGRAIRPAA